MLVRARVAVFRYGTRLQRALQRRLTPAGRLVAGGTLAGLAFGLDVRQTAALQIAAMLFGLLVVSASFLPRPRPKLRVQRSLPPLATVGVPLTYTLTIEQPDTASAPIDIVISDQLDSPLPDATAMRFAREPAGVDSWLERLLGLRRWLRLIRARCGARVDEGADIRIAGGGTVTTPLRLVPLRRGYVRFTTTTIRRADPLGLINTVIDLPNPGTLLVLPRRYPIPRIELAGHRRYQVGGAHRASRVGDSREFLSLRDYVSGDPRRHIHWRSWAHTGKPIVRQFEDQYLSRQALILDTFTREAARTALDWPGQGDDVFEAAVSLAASFVVASHPADTVVDLMFIGTRAVHVQAGRSLGAPTRMLELLACAEPAPDVDFDTLTRLVQTQLGQLSAAILILLRWDTPRRRLVEYLRQQGVPIAVIVIDDTGAAASDSGPMSDQPQRFCVVHPDHVERDLARLAGSPPANRWRARA